ncbi:DHA2 family multidrug resistance protein-like MFS transporter [Micromonospora pisi]|uniref:DHA2 family multidrug resistance protein-like MFS transporter n=1 Tax=Micromonospora pisi TaxID=589240 RepID=A0A495JCZ9_9ACTN|nr:MFS transporter [Micromonospora pisi]RKR86890.1 DHA2 family multidrug resistance protein-like MFS transporter [Micromonospora pisi]
MNANVSVGEVPKAGRREWIGLAVLALPTLLLSLDISVLNLALPHLSEELGANSTEQLWIVDIYGFMIAGFLLTWGTLGDRIGRRKLLLIGAALFGAASVLAAYADSPTTLILARAVLGISGATLMPSLLALISNMFKDPTQQGLAIGVWMSCFMGGMAIGPVVGGAMLESFWWGSVFLIGLPVMALLLVLGPILLPEYKAPEAGRLDLLSAVLSLAALLPIIYAVKKFAADGLGVPQVLSLLVGLACGTVFVLRQRRLAHPLLDLRLFGNRTLRAALGVALLCSATMGGITLLVAMYLQQVAGLSPLVAGLWLVPSFILAIAGNMAAPALAARFKPSYAIAGGLLVTAVGLVMLTQVNSTGSIALVVIGYAIAFAGTSPMGVLSTQLVVGSAPPEKAGAASALSETNGEFGIAFGVAALGSLGAAVYQGRMAEIPAEIPSDAATAAQDSLPAASATAGELPGQLGTVLLDVARNAFTGGLHVVATVSAIAMVLFAVIALVLLRTATPGVGATEEQSPEETARPGAPVPPQGGTGLPEAVGEVRR